MNIEQPFWVVWADGGGAPTVKHETIERAKAESIRLARANPGQRFIVLQAVGACEKNDVIHTVFRRQDPWGPGWEDEFEGPF